MPQTETQDWPTDDRWESSRQYLTTQIEIARQEAAEWRAAYARACDERGDATVRAARWKRIARALRRRRAALAATEPTP